MQHLQLYTATATGSTPGDVRAAERLGQQLAACTGLEVRHERACTQGCVLRNAVHFVMHFNTQGNWASAYMCVQVCMCESSSDFLRPPPANPSCCLQELKVCIPGGTQAVMGPLVRRVLAAGPTRLRQFTIEVRRWGSAVACRCWEGLE